MFILPFLKYFKPYIGRLLIAIPCMVLVAVLSATPLLIAHEAIDVLAPDPSAKGLKPGKEGKVDKNEKFNNELLNGLNTLSQSKNNAGKEGLHKKYASMASGVDKWAEGLAGHYYAGPRDWVKARVDRGQEVQESFKKWYKEKKTNNKFQILEILSALLISATAAAGVAEFLSKYELSYIFFLTNLQIREDIFGNILQQDYTYFNHNSPGYLHSRINSDVKAVRAILEGLLSDGIQQPITILVMFIVLMFLHVKLTLGVMLCLPVIGGLLYYFAKVLRKNTGKQKKKEDQLSSSLTESLNNIRLVKAFGTEKIEMGKFHERTMALFRYMMARRMAKFGSSPLMEFIGSVAVGGIILVGGWMIGQEQMHFSDFVIYLFTLSRFYRPLKSLATLNTKMQEARVSNERMLEMLALRPQLHDNPDAKPFATLKEGIEIKQVGFRYDNKQILEGISMSVKAGQRVALAGPSGGGKTTLVNMLARLFDPYEGQILIDGVDLRDYRIADWRKHLAIVTQDTFLFDDTIESNIAYGMGEVDVERVLAAARAANAHEFIMELDGGQGYKTRIGPTGGRLSGGQRQRLAIARAIYRDPKILILDEATSALDAQSQAIVQEALNHLMAGRTTFVIAHRTSTIRNVDCIYVIDEGRILEQGTHDELMEHGGMYRAMVTKVGLIKESPAAEEPAGDGARQQRGMWPEEATVGSWPDE